MCEIAVLDPEQVAIETIHRIADRFHEEQGDGLGVLAVKNEGDSFDYRAYKSTDPHWQTMFAFLRRNYDDTWRFVVHGRASTSGKVNRNSAHPIEVDCDKCDFDYVVHNGSVRNYQNIRSGLIGQDHEFNTGVDTEVLAHKVSYLPDTVQDHTRSTYSFRGNLNYLLFSEDGIMVRVSKKYHLTDDFCMTCSLSEMGDYRDMGFERGTDNEWMLIHPGENEPYIETKERASYSRSGSAYSGSRSSSSASSKSDDDSWYGKGTSGDDADSGSDTVTVEYHDYSQYEKVSAIKVAPGVIKVIDNDGGNSTFIKRRDEPKMYYFYAPEPEPENIEELDALANARIDHAAEYSDEQETTQTSLDSIVEDHAEDDSGNVEQEVAAETMRSMVETVEDLSMLDVAEVQDEILEEVIGTTGA